MNRPTHTNKTVAAILIDALRELGVKFVFGVPSGGWIDYLEALRATDGIDFVLTTHEGGAGMMAEVCGRLGDAPGVCFGTFGPGATNLSTGVGEALLDRSPMIALTDEMPANMRGRVTQMGIDHQALFRPLTKKTTRLRADSVRSIVFDAARIASSERPGPVHIGLPVGMSSETVAVESIAYVPADPPLPANPTALEKAAVVFAGAKRPLLAVGLGAVRAGLADDIRQMAHKHKIPVVLTPMAKGLLAEDDPWYVGVLFHALSDIVAVTYRQADVIIGVGYDPVELNLEAWLPAQATLVNLDTEGLDIDRSACAEVVDVVGNLSASFDLLSKLPAVPNAWNMEAVQRRRKEMFGRLQPAGKAFGPSTVLTALREVLPADGIMTCDVGAHTHLLGQLWKTPAPGLQIMTNGWSTMGFGLPAAIAAKLMYPNKAVCTVVGDGGFLMTAGELAVAVRMELNIVVLLLTDSDLALIRIKQHKKGNAPYGTRVRDQSTIGSDNIFGVPVRVARNASELHRSLQIAFDSEGPTIIEAVVDGREYDDVLLRPNK